MQVLKHFYCSVAFLSVRFMVACGETGPETVTKSPDTTKAVVESVNKSLMPVYDSTMDPLLVGSAFTKKLDDSLGIRILEGTLKPGDSMGLHTHPDHAVYILKQGKAQFYFPGQGLVTPPDDEPVIKAWVTGPVTDALKNIGNTPIQWIEIDIYRPRGLALPPKPSYDSAIDAYNIGGESIEKLADTLDVKMFLVTMRPGDTATLHSHPDHTVYVLEGGELAITSEGGPRQVMQLKKGTALVGGPLIDAAKNTGKSTIKLLMTHIYRPRP